MSGCQKSEAKKCSKDVKGRSQNRCAVALPKECMRIVQFPHPGQEYPVCLTNARFSKSVYAVDWSELGFHCRRLIEHSGSYVDADWCFYEGGGLVFWNEWEGPTFAKERSGKKSQTSASYIHTIRYPEVPNKSTSTGSCNSSCCCSGLYGDLMNTDPCVFGKTFKYSICRQTPKGIMRRLAPGSLIVFGSRINGEFYLDTVFVVGDMAIDYRNGNDLRLQCSREYRNLTIDRLPIGDYTYYRGVVPDKRHTLKAQCFSFVPARLSSSADCAERCRIDLEQLNEAANAKAFDIDVWRNKKATKANKTQVKDVWNDIVRQVTGQGFVLGVHFDWPKK